MPMAEQPARRVDVTLANWMRAPPTPPLVAKPPVAAVCLSFFGVLLWCPGVGG